MRNASRAMFAILVVLLVCSRPMTSAAGQVLPPFGADAGSRPTAQPTIAQGLKEALRVGAENAVSRTGRIDGFFRNEAIKILLPDRLRRAESALRMVGYGPQVDEFVLAMNRAAERAAASAKPIFWNAIQGMTIEDARGILTGGDTAATQYFRARTQDQLAAAFRPIVEQATNEVGVTRQYKDLIQALPFGLGEDQSLNIDEYVVGKTLDGLFYVLGEEERRIRTDPAARITEILRQVFGK